MNERNVEALSDQEVHELRRVLAVFKGSLPQHELGYWHITRQPVEVVVENEDPPNVHRMGYTASDKFHIQGHGICVRCNRQFSIPKIGNFTTWEDRIKETIESAKEWVRRDASRAGPCWGEVPKAPSRRDSGLVLDHAEAP